MAKTSALKAFYGASEAEQKRPQTVLTPPCIVAGLERLWPDGIDLDPCSCPESLVPAKFRFLEADGNNGLDRGWWGHVYVNEPFDQLKAWLAKCQTEWRREEVMAIVNLCPWRSRRPWFRAAYKDADAVMLLDPVTFYDSTTGKPWASASGQVSQFPENCCLLYWGTDPRAFEAAFADLGEPL
jgi:DNA N-6-adenine-methyltransferase Dam